MFLSTLLPREPYSLIFLYVWARPAIYAILNIDFVDFGYLAAGGTWPGTWNPRRGLRLRSGLLGSRPSDNRRN